jgi:hypothetical protein
MSGDPYRKRHLPRPVVGERSDRSVMSARFGNDRPIVTASVMNGSLKNEHAAKADAASPSRELLWPGGGAMPLEYHRLLLRPAFFDAFLSCRIY